MLSKFSEIPSSVQIAKKKQKRRKIVVLLQKERYEGRRGGLKTIPSSFLACQCNACLCTKESGKSGAQIKSSVQKPGDFFFVQKAKRVDRQEHPP